MRLLLVEDDSMIGEAVLDLLRAEHHAVDWVRDGDMADTALRTQRYDLVLLDLGLPRLPGLEVLRRWRAKRRNMPVLVLTARDAWTERVDGLNAGADDYLGKPFQTAEVVARLRALVRRSAGDASPILVHEDVRLDVTGGAATLEGRPVDLTARELRILGYLMHRQGRIVSQAELMDHVYALDDIRESNTIEVYVGRLRKKLGKDCIRTIRGLGYRVG